MQVVRPKERHVVDALALSELLLATAETQGITAFAVSVVQGPAVILGAMQRAGRVVVLTACEQAGVTVVRRVTTGTAVWVGGTGIILSLALPHVAAIQEDATHRTLLNRNVRPFLRAFSRGGVMAHYFGREWISLRKQPAALLGYEVTRAGAVLIDVILGVDQSLALPTELMTAEERAVDRFMGKTPAGLSEIAPEARGVQFADRLVEGMVGAEGANHFLDFEDAALARFRSTPITNDRDPLPADFAPRALGFEANDAEGDPKPRVYKLERVPIGYVEKAVSQDEPHLTWLGGDVLAPRWLYEDIAKGMDAGALASAPIDGAQVQDLVRVMSDV